MLLTDGRYYSLFCLGKLFMDEKIMKKTTKSQEIINVINGNGGLDSNYMTSCAKQDGVSLSDYVTSWVKNYYDVHGNTARVIAKYFV